MFSSFERKIAFRYLKPSRKEGFISVIAGFSFLGILLGVATLIIVMSVMNGFREKLIDSILGFNGHIAIHSVNPRGMTNFDPIKDTVRNIKGIQSATPLIERQAMITHKGRALGGLVHGIRLEDLRARTLISSKITFGTLDDFTQENAIVLGRRMAEKLGVLPGDFVSLVAPEGSSTAFGTVPRMRQFKVAGIFNVGMIQYDSGIAFIPLGAAQKFFRMPETVSGLEVFIDQPDSVRAMTQTLKESLGPSVRLLDWQAMNAGYSTALQVERNVMFIILTLIIVVAAFNIISTLIMLVKDKGPDIAILRTMGATRGHILRIFILTGASIGVVGTLVGSALGLLFALNIESIRKGLEKLLGLNLFNPEVYFLSQLPAKVDWMEVATVVITALVLVFVATIIPARRAARLDPVEALRYE